MFFESLDEDFPALADPDVTVVAQATTDEASAWVPRIEALDGVTGVDPPRDLGSVPGGVQAAGSDPDGPHLVSIDVRTEGGAMDDEARTVSSTLMDAEPSFPTGSPARRGQSLQDFTAAVADGAPWAALWIAGATFLLLFLLTGSVVIPVKALVLNVVSLGGASGSWSGSSSTATSSRCCATTPTAIASR